MSDTHELNTIVTEKCLSRLTHSIKKCSSQLTKYRSLDVGNTRQIKALPHVISQMILNQPIKENTSLGFWFYLLMHYIALV